MKKIVISIIVLSVIVALLIGFIIFQNIYHKKQISKLTISNDELLQKVDVMIKERLKDYKPVTIKEIQIMTDKEKEELIMKQQKIIEDDTLIINELRKNLNDSNEELKKKSKLKNEIQPFISGGFLYNQESQKIEEKIEVGVIYQRNVFQNNKVSVSVGGGASIQVRKQIGGSGILSFSISF